MGPGFAARMTAWAVACCISALPAMAAAAETVKIAHLGIVADAPFYIAIDKGYFAKEGVSVALVKVSSAAQATLPLATDEVQVAGGAMSAGLFNAFARGLPIRVAMARTRDMPGFSSDTLLVRDDLRSTVHTLKDLKGRRIAINAPAAALDYMVAKMLASAGVAFNEVNTIYMPWPDMGAAFANKGIDAGAVTEPFAAIYDRRKLAFLFRRAADVLRDPPLEVSVILYGESWIDRNPHQVTAFTIAYLEGVRDYYNAMRGGPLRAEVVDILMKYTSLKDESAYDRIQWSYMDPNAELSMASLKDQLAWYESRHAIEKKVDVASMIDTRFLDQALRKLGRVTVK